MTGTRSKHRIQNLGEVFTAAAEVNLMLDMLSGDAEDPSCVILEPACGHGNFLVEIVSRRVHAGDPFSAIANVHGIDICADNVTEAQDRIITILNAAFPMEMSGETGVKVRDQITRNVRQGDFLLTPETEVACDVIIGNPPYQSMDGGHGASARPIYQHFVLRSKAVARRKVCLIIPARWYTGGKGLDAFRRDMLADRSIAKIVDWENSSICFPGVDISGGICVVLMDKAHDGDCLFVQQGRAAQRSSPRDLRTTAVLIRDVLGAAIVEKALHTRTSIQTVVRPRNAFGMATNFTPSGAGDIFVLTNAGWKAHAAHLVTKRAELIPTWKVFVSGSAFEHAGAAGKDGKRRVLSRIIIAPPSTAATETYILIEAFDTQAQAECLAAYLSTRTVRYLVSLAASSHHITRDRFRFVPAVDLSVDWDDAGLARLFGLDEQEIRAIEGTIRAWPEMEIRPHVPS